MPPGSASISVRSYIAYLPHPLPPGTPIPYTPFLSDHGNPLSLSHPSEPTSTLVLTTPHSTYLDIRVYKPNNPTSPTSTPNPLPNSGGPSWALSWAFCGQSFSAPANPAIVSATNLPVKHATWHHWLDSKYGVGSPEIPIDEGDMYTMSPTQTIEFGSAYNASTNMMESYEEMWLDMRILSTEMAGKKICAMVLKLDEPVYGVRGIVVRVGQFVQGLLKRGNEVTVERWEFLEQKDGQGNVVGGDWTRLVRLGDLFLPCAVAFEPEKVELGTIVTYELYAWAVEEVEIWTDEEQVNGH